MFFNNRTFATWLSTSVCASALLINLPAVAQQSAESVEEIVVTGSRIRQSVDTVAPAPVSIINSDTLAERGYVSAGKAINELTSMRPPVSNNNFSASAAIASGQSSIGSDLPNLFNLGAGRTLTLINGRRVISSTGGLGDEAVDANLIPAGLIQRIDVVQGGGASVYGSGAIGGVINYILKDHFNGFEFDAQASGTSHGDYPAGSVRIAGGTDFAGGKGSILGAFEFTKTGHLTDRDRSLTELRPFAAVNTAPGAGTNGIPATIYVPHLADVNSSQTGTINTVASGFLGEPLVLHVGGRPVRCNVDCSALVPFNPGTPALLFLVYNGEYDNERTFGPVTLVPAVEREVGNLIVHYDLTDSIRLSTEATVAKKIGALPKILDASLLGSPSFASIPADKPYPFRLDNPYLSPSIAAQLSAASPSFASGGALYLGKSGHFLYPNEDGDFAQKEMFYRFMGGFDGEFNALDRRFYWSASYTYGQYELDTEARVPAVNRMYNAADAVKNAAGDIVCRVNADADTTNNDPACVPFNIFAPSISNQARDYIMVDSSNPGYGVRFPATNTEHDVLLTLGGDVMHVPAGQIQFSTSYEYRSDRGEFTPKTADQLGLVFSTVAVTGASGSFHVSELGGELKIPVFGRDFSLPGVQELELSGSARYVDHSITGSDNAWGASLRWKVIDDVSLRGTIGRNFRAPNLAQLVLPPSVGVGGVTNPCFKTAINSGPNPTVRRANCVALFQANPLFGTEFAPAGSSADARLANFTDTEGAQKRITTSGNPGLTNEIANTKSYGVVLTPSFIPNLVITADRMNLRMRSALISFGPNQFMSTCFDTTPQPADYCNTVTYKANGQVATAKSTFVNAGYDRLDSEMYSITYEFALASLLGGGDKGRLNIGLQATHNTFQSEIIQGVETRTDGTPLLPTWQTKLDLHYGIDRWRVNYTFNYLPQVKTTFTSTPLNSPNGNPYIGENARHSISAEYEVLANVKVRAGINNFTDQQPSFPTNYYGDYIGRQFFAGVNVKY